MFVTVYAIAKNEEKHVERFMAWAHAADAVVVLDTGSTDGTVGRLRRLGATVHVETFTPWRFDKARNRSLELIPPETDVCVCLDLDEILTDGWRDVLERHWKPGETEQAHYRYVWNYLDDGSEGTTFNKEKIHAPGLFKWKHPVHEVLTRLDGEPVRKTVYLEGMTCEHRADDAKSRSSYLPLLELAVEEEPDDDRNMHYLGREYMYRGRWLDAIRTLKRHLALPRATWKDERCASMRFIGRCWDRLGAPHEALHWYRQAASEAPHLREPWYELARKLYHEFKDYEGVVHAGENAPKVRQNHSYIQDAAAWGAEFDDMLCVAYCVRGDYRKAIEHAERALALYPEGSPDASRVRANIRSINALRA